MPPENLPDDWLDFYFWAVGEADRESEGTPDTQLINHEGTVIQ